jgi:multiple sugar transport system ATP-binding protein
MTSSPAIQLDGVHKSYGGGGAVLRGIDLEIDEGELVTIVGPSGCGKSTLLSLIAGFERPTRGHVRLHGEIVDDKSPRERRLAMVFQSYALYPHLDVFENIAFPLRIAKLPAAEVKARVEETAARLGLSALQRRRPAQLSGGQRQRVALARALVRRPSICLFDEPLSNLDAALRAEMRAEIKKLHQELGSTFVYVTHDQSEAMTLSDRIVVLDAGAIAQAGPPMEIYERPLSTFVASFLGSPGMNLVAPEALGLEGTSVSVTVGVRPEDLRVTREPSPGSLPARVYVVEPVGSETWVTCERASCRLVGRAEARFDARSGDTVHLRFEANRLHRFDRATGARTGEPLESLAPAGD